MYNFFLLFSSACIYGSIHGYLCYMVASVPSCTFLHVPQSELSELQIWGVLEHFLSRCREHTSKMWVSWEEVHMKRLCNANGFAHIHTTLKVFSSAFFFLCFLFNRNLEKREKSRIFSYNIQNGRHRVLYTTTCWCSLVQQYSSINAANFIFYSFLFLNFLSQSWNIKKIVCESGKW